MGDMVSDLETPLPEKVTRHGDKDPAFRKAPANRPAAALYFKSTEYHT